MLQVISLGAGVQSTTMALMAAHGELTPMPDAAIFADTQAEPRAVYDHLRWLMSANVLPFPVHVVTNGNLRDFIGTPRVRGKWPHVPIPAYFETDRGRAPMSRNCTRDYKINPIMRKVRELLGLTGKRSPKDPMVEQWIGISTDEATRMKPSRFEWTLHRWPLIEKRMSRGDCLAWLERHNYPRPPKSACTFCPYHHDRMWADMKVNDRESWDDAVAIDRRIRPMYARRVYLHPACVPLDEVEFGYGPELDLFQNECEGMCGV